jgi:PTH1 family peptidyl-tRNA hydrolase
MVVGLGNPGSKYEWTRHNIGFEALNRLHTNLVSSTMQSNAAHAKTVQTKFEGQFFKTKWNGNDVCLVWPLTYMNCSGRCVAQFARFYRIEPEHILVICDDLSLPLGKLRIRKSGSSGGQKGLENILNCLGTQDVPRLRIGIDPTPEQWETVDYVLGKFTNEETVTVKAALDRTCNAIERWLVAGIDVAMNEFNAAAAVKKHENKRKQTPESE